MKRALVLIVTALVVGVIGESLKISIDHRKGGLLTPGTAVFTAVFVTGVVVVNRALGRQS